MVENKLGVFVFLSLILLTSWISAATLGTPKYSITKTYDEGNPVKGWINITLTGESISSVLKSSFGEQINLKTLLDKNSNSLFDYTCIPYSCTSTYIATKEETSKILNLVENQIIFIGMNISKKTGLLSSIDDSFTLNFASNNTETEKFPLAIDIKNDGIYEWDAYKASANYQGENSGCFDGTQTSTSYPISTTPYCQRVTLKRAPETEIGAYIEEVAYEEGTVFGITIKKTGTSQEGSCSYEKTVSGNQRVSCTPTGYSIKEDGDYFVCIRLLSEAGKEKYEIGAEQQIPVCGFTGTFNGAYSYDFDIFTRPKYYSSDINLDLSNDEVVASGTSVDLVGYMEDYIDDTYKNNCSNDCIIPIKIFSGIGQRLEISGLHLLYEVQLSPLTLTDKLYNITETSGKMYSSKFQKLFLTDSGFMAPEEEGDYTLSVSLDNTGLFSETISVMRTALIQSRTPTKTAIRYETQFSVFLDDEEIEPKKYKWNFGDGTSETTAEGSTSHTYTTSKDYKWNVTITDTENRNYSKEFTITVGPVSTIVPELLDDAEANIDYLKGRILDFSGFQQRALNYSLKISELEKNITTLRNSITDTSPESKYEEVFAKLLKLSIPFEISETAYSEELLFYPKKENIDLDIIKEVAGGDYESSKENTYKEAVLAWEAANADSIMTYNEISSIYPDYEKPLVKTFEFSITNNGGDAYFIIEDMENLVFAKDYSQDKEDGYYYIPLESGENNISFFTTENVDFISLPGFVAPALSELILTEVEVTETESNSKRWVLFAIIVAVILFSALILWVILQTWYKRKYENYLFKNRNNLYNLVNYIANEKHKGTGEGEMLKKLKKAGWNSEQIRYALKKHAGKRTGMPEIISLGKKKNNLQKK